MKELLLILKLISSPYRAGSTVCFGFLFWKTTYSKSCTTLWIVPIRDLLHKVKLQFLSPAIMDVSFALDEIEERDI